MKKRGLILAAAAASLMLAGCATQGATDNTSVAQPAPAAENTCKGVANCKGMANCKSMKAKKHHKAKKAAKAADEAATTAQ